MNVTEAIESRRSQRIYTDRPVDRALLEEIITLAGKAPSALNLQPWLFTVVLGDELARLSRTLVRAFKERNIGCAPAAKSQPPQVYLDRQSQLFAQMGPVIKQTESPWSDFTNLGSLHFYGAPAGIVISGEAAFDRDAEFDLGLAVGYLLLACQERGLGTCPVGLVSRYADLVGQALNLDSDRPVILALAVGWPEEGAAINQIKTGRAPVDEILRWYA